MKRMKLMTLACLTTAVAFFGEAIDADDTAQTPNLVPYPKKYEAKNKTFTVSNLPFFVEKENKQCDIGATDVAKRVEELGGKPGAISASVETDLTKNGVFILTVSNPLALNLKKKYDLTVTAEDPGPQGYVIHTGKNQLVVIGSDSVGALYGAMTLRQMLRKGDDGSVEIIAADVYDKPDYRYRGGMPFGKGLMRWAEGEKNPLAACKAAIDWMARFKINLLKGYKIRGKDLRALNPTTSELIKKVNKYAVDRGIFPICWSTTSVATPKFDDISMEDWDCLANHGLLWCWSKDALTKKKIDRVAKFCADHHYKILALHPVDGGGIADPEQWSMRCPECRKRWGDDERAKASVEQFNKWIEAFKKLCPDMILTSPIYPYSAAYGKYSPTMGVDEKTWRHNSIDYWKAINDGVDPALVPMTWPATRPDMNVFRACYPNRPIMTYAFSLIPLGYFSTFSRLVKTDYDGNPGDISYMASGFNAYSKWLNLICFNEFSWNTDAPGAEECELNFYHPDRDHAGPDVIMNEWVPRACQAFFGEAMGSAIAPVFQAGVQDLYIMDPGRGVFLANKMLKSPLADVDPTKKVSKSSVNQGKGTIRETPERMKRQVEATSEAMTALENAYRYYDQLDKYRRKTFMFYYKRMPLWHMIARARLAIAEGKQLARMGNYRQADKILKEGLTNLEGDWKRANAILTATKDQPDVTPRGPIKFKNGRNVGDVKPSPEKLRKMLKDQLASVNVVLKPRRPGPVVNVGLHRGHGAKSTELFFKDFKNVKAEIIDSLSLATLDKFDCVFVFQSSSLPEDDVFINLVRYVKEGGGGVVFQHDLVGFGRSPLGKRTPFPSVCAKGSKRKDGTKLTATVDHPALGSLKKGDEADLMYIDYIVVEPGEAATVIARDGDGENVVAVGEVGHGKVAFDGNISLGSVGGTYKGEERKLTGFNAILTQGLTEWMTGVKLERK